MTQVYVVAGDGDDGHGGMRFHDLTTGEIIRDFPRNPGNTDDVSGLVYHENHIYSIDSDNNLVCFDADNILISKVELGYNYNPGESICVFPDGIGILKSNKDFGDEARVDAEATALYIFDFVSLDFVRRVVLNDPLLFSGGYSTINVNTLWYFSGDAFFFVQSGNNTDWYKVNHTSGAVIATYTPGIGNYVEMSSVRVLISGKLARFMSGFSFYELNFDDPTLSRSINLSTPTDTAWNTSHAPTYGGYINNVLSGQPLIDGTRMYFTMQVSGGNDPAFPARNGMINLGTIVGFDLADGGNIAISNITPLYSYDGWKRTEGYYSPSGYAEANVVLSTTSAIYSFRRSGMKSTNGVRDFWISPKLEVSQEYSSDGDYIACGRVFDFTSHTISGTITDAAGTTDREILAYDDELPDEMICKVVTDSPYSIEFFSPRPKRLICKSIDNTKNDQVLSHIIPV
jgi:hypothetical protein